MKKIISALLIITMLVSMVCVSTSAAEGMYLQSDFTSEDSTARFFHLGEFYVEPVDGMLYGYSGAKALQTRYDDEDIGNNPYGWVSYDVSCEMAFEEDTLVTGDRSVHLTHCNTALIDAGLRDTTYYMNFSYDITNMQFWLSAGNLGIDSENILAGPIDRELAGDGTEFYTFGMSITENRIRCFLDGELIFDFVDTTGEHMITTGRANPLVLWNENNFLKIKSYNVSSPGFQFPMAVDTPTDTSDTAATETSATESKETSETTTKIVEEIVTNDEGETSIVTKIETEATTTTTAAPADTNTGAVTGGNATATGDSAFVVVAAMVATLGCALIVKKVHAE